MYSTTTKITTFVFLVVSIAGGAFIFLQGFSSPTQSVSDWTDVPVVDTPEKIPAKETPETTTPTPVVIINIPPPKIPTTTPAQIPPPIPKNLVTLTETGFSPDVINIKFGDVVTFLNKSSRPMWPAAAEHPVHRDYPTTGSCLGSTFDPCKGIPIGGSWSFKVDIPGSWRYHNHLDPRTQGIIVAE